MTEGTKLADRLLTLGYTVTDAAAATRIDRYAINDYLHRRRQISPRDLQRLADFLGCEPESLV